MHHHLTTNTQREVSRVGRVGAKMDTITRLICICRVSSAHTWGPANCRYPGAITTERPGVLRTAGTLELWSTNRKCALCMTKRPRFTMGFKVSNLYTRWVEYHIYILYSLFFILRCKAVGQISVWQPNARPLYMLRLPICSAA